MSDEACTVNVKGLEKLLKALKGQQPNCRVGILGEQPRKDGGKTNAEVGAAHEFGTTTLPKRSFLRVPIIEGLDAEMESSGLLTEKTTKEVIRSGSVAAWLFQVATCAEACVADAFATGGNGKWKETKRENNTGMILVDTQQLRNSITSEVG